MGHRAAARADARGLRRARTADRPAAAGADPRDAGGSDRAHDRAREPWRHARARPADERAREAAAPRGRGAHRAARRRRVGCARVRSRADLRRAPVHPRASGRGRLQRSGRPGGTRAVGSLAVSLYLPDDTGPPTVHPDGLHTAVHRARQRRRRGHLEAESHDDGAISGCRRSTSWRRRPRRPSSRLATRLPTAWARRSTRDRAWASLLAAKLSAGRPGESMSVANAGLSGNRLLRHGFGISALARFDRDVLSMAGVRWMTRAPGHQRHHVPGSARACRRRKR